ncbi:dimethylsulfoxide reductase [Plesiomonas shigelloides]|uniref:TorD/DmsD family molecular chaperone n=1 Tax=Plesiomonas shigelloides TaxID=703 RepID=UPI000D57296C|nr:molecular chaperone [Plesiomonas shigelloides]PVU67925.1 dimethylsulfoxide reductase [Plesiomonas shigelloides]
MIINTSKLLGILFHQKKNKAELIEIVAALHDDHILSVATLDALVQLSEDDLTYSFTELFEGVGVMKAPPWGSVYLDRERVVFGESTIKFRQFLSDNGVVLNTGVREPEDQFGLMLFAFAFFLERDQTKAANELMERHLLTWCYFYLRQLRKFSPNEFYRNLSTDVIAWLNDVVFSLDLNVEEKKIFTDV